MLCDDSLPYTQHNQCKDLALPTSSAAYDVSALMLSTLNTSHHHQRPRTTPRRIVGYQQMLGSYDILRLSLPSSYH